MEEDVIAHAHEESQPTLETGWKKFTVHCNTQESMCELHLGKWSAAVM